MRDNVLKDDGEVRSLIKSMRRPDHKFVFGLLSN